MEAPSGPGSRRRVPWNRLLLAASFFTFWTPPTTAQLTIETVPPLAAEGSSVLLLAHNMTENPLGYAWYTGERVENSQLIASYRIATNVTTKGPAHSGRQTLYPNGTLLIQNVNQKDTGSYTLLITKDDLQKERQTGHLHVHRLLQQPSIQVSDPMDRDKENKVVITCNTNETDITIKWICNGQYIKTTKNIFLSEDGKKLTIDPIKEENAGKYQCEIFNIGTSNKSGIFELKAKKSGRLHQREARWLEVTAGRISVRRPLQ
ncbi:hypothetical protein FD754_014776 [Muntiacus muntjak]|uniref:Ig-like domain-containing protein n=1 Tax=Muntiacus muntjak TaxID=9888 RepID=A0A5N3VKU0_MUNMU|nr:hypothetical protein FD754_014776 [Muntiacus muntjak]